MATFRVTALTLSRKATSVARAQLCFRACQRTWARSSSPTVLAKYSTASTTIEQPSRAPIVDRAASKLFKNADDAVADLKSGSTILSSGFGLCGVAGA